ncbi:MAG: SDR family oxidoreductase [Flavobacteriaceae bacterium]|nr:SDR family oxidoreductase [Flavobacteriaceae bacterium]
MILVTGGTGLVGAHLLYHLALENDVIKAIYRTEESLVAVKRVFFNYSIEGPSLFSKIEWVQADITDVPSLEHAFIDVTIVYHAAAMVSFDLKVYRTMRQVNIEGTANIVNFCIDKKVQKLCFVSSIAAVEESLHSGEINEENEWNGTKNKSGYSITKYGAEMEVWRASQEGVDVVIVNPGVILGSGFWTVNSGEFFTQIVKGFRFYTDGITGFVGVADVVKIMVHLMKSDIKNERFILVGENKSFKEIFWLIARGLGKRRPKIKVTKAITSFLWRIGGLITLFTGKTYPLTEHTAKSMHSKHFYSSKKIQSKNYPNYKCRTTQGTQIL